MKLTLHHLHRIRRRLRRTITDLRHLETLRILEEWTGHRPPPKPRDPMKFIGSILLLLVLIAFILAFAGCSTVETKTTVTDPVTGFVTVTESKTTAPAPGSVDALSATALLLAPRAVIVRQEKSSPDIRHILRGRPITRQEIVHRWQPAAP